MNAIICLDDNLGMAFNGRRQSKDRYVREIIISLCSKSNIYMNAYSFKQFEEECDNIIVDEHFLEKAKEHDFCFIENCTFSPENIDRLYVFFWNRVYPADLKLGFDIEKSGFSIVDCCDFEGYSHEKITLKTYERRA